MPPSRCISKHGYIGSKSHNKRRDLHHGKVTDLSGAQKIVPADSHGVLLLFLEGSMQLTRPLRIGANGSARLNKVGRMNQVTFPNACQLMRWHFHPVGFEASMDAPSSMIARLFDRASGETVIAIAGIPCSTVMNATDVERIIEAIEAELESFIPPQVSGFL